MTNGELLTQARSFVDRMAGSADDYTGAFGAGQQWILENFGQNGLYAAYIVLAALAVFLITRLLKITLSAVKYLVIPGIGLALLGSFVLPYPFLFLLPITMTACSLLLLFKG